MKSPDNKMSKRKIRRISETRNVEGPNCRSLLPNVGINDTSSSSSIGVVSIEDAALLTIDNIMTNDDDYEKDFEDLLLEDDFFGFEDLECLWW